MKTKMIEWFWFAVTRLGMPTHSYACQDKHGHDMPTRVAGSLREQL